uniref:enoyl-CoA delta isomerase 2, mitochondrial isoform X1 n=1 Tax=Ciona intestinalis TaxID=7719 RepID=UPI000180C46D|nr:enoyl-CoA delta isomerase 2, mitochondrial isoform X1 [Ciona intestinalis]XP_026689625.1 enoyl-CoA delta isomerase 2, mitochondrial isoform X1 [Ciona intestinalis]|eukprot:XP_009858013.1 enoyl-CoA delta isomerase 2, mitochondrial isoform X1 [Ciona intestinalis]
MALRQSYVYTAKTFRSLLKNQSIRAVRMLSSKVDGDFETAKQRLNTLKQEPGNDVKLQIYALFKQATIGANNTKRPGTFNFVGQAKWNAWNDLGPMSKDEAKEEYVKIVKDLSDAEGEAEEEVGDVSSSTDYQNLIVTKQNNYTKIVLNRPTKKNALTREMYEEIIVALNEAGKDDTAVTVMTGAGDYYCSGNDLGNFMVIKPEEMHQVAKESGDLLRRYVNAYIDFPKPLVAAINGPAIGVSVTALGLFDLVLASENATFSTPFSRLGQSPEGCSSYTFPKIMGHAKACDMMLFNNKLTATEAKECGLVTKIFPKESFETDVMSQVEAIAKLPVKSLIYSKALMRDPELDLLHKVNEAECDRLVERWPSEDCINAIMKFFQEKNK